MTDISSSLLSTPAYKPRTSWPAAWAILATLIIYGAGVLALSGMLSLDSFVRGFGRADGLWRRDMTGLTTIAVWQLATIALTLAASRLFGNRIREVLSLQPPAMGVRAYGIAVAVTIVAQAIIWLLGPWLFPAPAQPSSSTTLFGEQWWAALLVIGVGAPVSEEFLFRGFLLSALASTRLGFWTPAVLTAVWWTFLHAGYSVLGFVSVFLMGLVYSWQLWWSGSLRVPILCHALYNMLIIVLFGRLNLG